MYLHTLQICIKNKGDTQEWAGGARELKAPYVETNLWLGQRLVVVGLVSWHAVPANAFVPRAVLIYSVASIMITNAPSLSSLLPAYNLRESLPET